MNSFDSGDATGRASSWRRWILFAFALAVVTGAILVASFRWPEGLFFWMDRVPWGDKAGHFLLIGGLALSLNWALRGRPTRIGPVTLQLGGVLVAAIITAEEFSQLWVPARSFDWADLAANYAGIACADWLARRWLR